MSSHHQSGAREERWSLWEMGLIVSWMGCKSKEVLKKGPIVQKMKMEELKIVSHEAESPRRHEANVELDQGQLNHDQKEDPSQPEILLEKQVVA